MKIDRDLVFFGLGHTEGCLPISYSIDPEQRLVTSRIWGIVTNDEVNEHNRQLRSDQYFTPGARRALLVSDDTTFGLEREG